VWQGVEVCCWYHESGLGFSAVFFCAALLLVRFNLSGGILSVPHSIKNFQMLSFRACSILNEWGIWHIPVLLYTQSTLQLCQGSLLNHHQCPSSTWMMRRQPQYSSTHTSYRWRGEYISSASLDVHWKSMISVYLYMLQYLATVYFLFTAVIKMIQPP